MTLTTRQKVLIPALIIAFGVLGYQAYQLYSSSHLRDNSAKVVDNRDNIATLPEVSLSNNGNATVVQRPIVAQPATTATTMTAATIPPAPASGAVAVPNAAATAPAASYTQAQYNYLRLVNEYQTMQLQEMIAQTSQQIAEAKLRAAQAQAQLGRYSGTLDTASASNAFSISNLPPLPLADNGLSGMRLVYTGQQQGRWNATLQRNGQYFDVNVGSLVDGGTITNINDNAVTLNRNGQQLQISFYGSQVVGEPSAANLAANQPVNSGIVLANNNPVDPATAAAIRQEGQVVQQAPVTEKQSANQLATAIKVYTKVNQTEAAEANNKTITANSARTATNTQAVTPIVAKSVATTASPTSAATMPAPVNITTPAATASTNSVSPTAAAATTTPANTQPVATVNKSITAAVSTMNGATQTSTSVAANNSAYTIQFIADHDRSAVVNFMQQYRLHAAEIYQFQKGTETWYALVQGRFDTAAEANTALQQLPQSAKKWQPFVIKMNHIDHNLQSVG